MMDVKSTDVRGLSSRLLSGRACFAVHPARPSRHRQDTKTIETWRATALERAHSSILQMRRTRSAPSPIAIIPRPINGNRHWSVLIAWKDRSRGNELNKSQATFGHLTKLWAAARFICRSTNSHSPNWTLGYSRLETRSRIGARPEERGSSGGLDGALMTMDVKRRSKQFLSRAGHAADAASEK